MAFGRGIDQERIGKDPEQHTLLTLARYIASFGLSCVLASIGTNMLTAPFDAASSTMHLQMSQIIIRDELSSAVAAFTLGAFVSWRWKGQSAAARFVWVVGLLWLAHGLSETMRLGNASVLYQQDLIHLVYSVISGANCIQDSRTCAFWGEYPLQTWRMIFYSAGAVCLSAYVHVRQRRAA